MNQLKKFRDITLRTTIYSLFYYGIRVEKLVTNSLFWVLLASKGLKNKIISIILRDIVFSGYLRKKVF